MSHLTIALDGPSGSGKSSVAKVISQRLGIHYLDTGAIYRTVGLYMLENGIDPKNEEAVVKALPDVKLDLVFEGKIQKMYLDKREVTDRVHDDDVSIYASDVSKHGPVRAMLLDLQRDVARRNEVIMDGRDIGTVILPNALVKIFLTAPIEVRAERRYKQMLEKGFETTYEEVLSDMKSRDENDRNRKIAPAVPADDAVILDNGDMTMEETISKIIEIIEEKNK
ncbi:MAG: (d)CMP kinase [Clostridia bacterium]|nr:(d)CMP kinase [Clostridia bacterium]